MAGNPSHVPSDGTDEPAIEQPETLDYDELAALRAIVEGTAQSIGAAFFQSLVGHLASAMGVNYAFVAEFDRTTMRARTLAYWGKGKILDNIEFDLAGTPCEEVIQSGLCHHPQGVREKFPEDRDLSELGIESYLGVPLVDLQGQVLGHLAVFDEGPLPPEPRRLSIFRIFATRAAVELERLRVEKQLLESERRYRELYEEAPNAYVAIGVDRRLLSVNHRATQLLGASASELVNHPVLEWFAETPTGRARAEEAFRASFGGEEIGGHELEMRRRDGRALWVSVWMRPMRGPDGRIPAVHSIWVDITDRMLAEAERARLQQQNLYLQEELQSVHNFEQIIGHSTALLAVLDKVGRVATTDATVLITGETGTGKELIARAIHSNSRRAARPMIKINCAALPAGLVESELFGHEKGAFTGAIARRIGRFELADTGTLFLDEIGELPLETQAKLLRVLQEHEIERVGGGTAIPVDVRIVVATNRDLIRAVRESTFREDLYYRLSVFPIPLPPLRERSEDIPLLVHFLVRLFAGQMGKRVDGVSPETMRRLVAYHWPGNIRELENVLERAVILAAGPILDFEIDAERHPTLATTESRSPRSLEDVERRHILAILEESNWIIEGPRGAAGILGLHPNTLRSRLKKLGIARSSHDLS
jgi:formate hydrogenlyase transcriptional activator